MNVRVVIHTKSGKGGVKYFESKEQASEWIGKHREKLSKVELTEAIELGAHLGDLVHSRPGPVGSMQQFAAKIGVSREHLEQLLQYGIDDEQDAERVRMMIDNGEYGLAKDELLDMGVLMHESKATGRYKFSKIYIK